MTTAYLLLAVNILLSITGQFFFKFGMLKQYKNLLEMFLSPLIIGGFLLYGLSAIIWLFILKRLPLSVAYPSLSLGYILLIIVSSKLLDEPITTPKIIGSLLIFLGVYFLFREA